MKKSVVLATAVMLAVPVCSFAAAWNVPTNVRIVQKSNTDTTGRIYGNIQSAINSITNASATNPYVVKVMPGVYDLGTASLQMKQYVTLEGSGAGDTIITSSIDDPTDSCSAATVTMADNSVLKNVTVNNVITDSGVPVYAVGLNNAKATVEGIKTNVAGSNHHNIGACVFGPAGQLTIERSNIEASNNGHQSSPVRAVQGAVVTVNNSKLLGIDLAGVVDVINCSWGLEGTPGTAVVSNSHIEGQAASGVYGVNGEACNLTITNSTIVGTTGMSSINVGQDGNGTPYSVKVANTLIQGGSAAIGGNASAAKLINNYDENFSPIANQ